MFTGIFAHTIWLNYPGFWFVDMLHIWSVHVSLVLMSRGALSALNAMTVESNLPHDMHSISIVEAGHKWRNDFSIIEIVSVKETYMVKTAMELWNHFEVIPPHYLLMQPSFQSLTCDKFDWSASDFSPIHWQCSGIAVMFSLIWNAKLLSIDNAELRSMCWDFRKQCSTVQLECGTHTMNNWF